MDTVTNAAGGVPGSTGRLFLHIVFASTSGHTEYVVDALTGFLRGAFPRWEVEERMAEKTQAQDLLRRDILLLASGSWDTWSIEGQLNPYMWALLADTAKNLDLAGKPCACIVSAITGISTRPGRWITCSAMLRRIMAG